MKTKGKKKATGGTASGGSQTKVEYPKDSMADFKHKGRGRPDSKKYK